jgi:hypothetical protein
MTSPDTPRHIEIKDGDQTVAAAEVTTSREAGGTARTSLHAASGHMTPGSRANLVDEVMDLPEVQASARLEAAIPLGDSESLERLRERTDETSTRPAGSTALVDASIPSASQPGSGHEPGGETSRSLYPPARRSRQPDGAWLWIIDQPQVSSHSPTRPREVSRADTALSASASRTPYRAAAPAWTTGTMLSAGCS